MSQIIYWTLVEADVRLPWWSGAGAPDFLSPAEKQKLEGMRFPRRRREWLLGRWTMKSLLQACHQLCTGLPLSGIQIDAEPGGAPILSIGGRPVQGGTITISHREDAAACAFASHLAVGLDLEIAEPRSEAFIRDFFTPIEAARALTLDGTSRDCYTALVWSTKEAVLKALRTGLRVDTRSIELAEHAQAVPNGWSSLWITTTLPGTDRIRAWWRQDGARVITLAVLGASEEEVERKFVPIHN